MKPAISQFRYVPARGVTLVELMVAVTLGLLITVVVAQLFLGSRQTYSTTDDLSRMQENIRFAEQLLARTIHLASYKSQPNTLTSTVFNAAAPALAVVDNNGATSDTLTLRYQGSGDGTSLPGCVATNTCTGADGSVVDCTGSRVDAGQMAVSTFTIAPGANGQLALMCNGVEMVSDVTFMRIFLGEDLNGDLVVDRYVTPGIANVNNALAVRIALLFQTPTASSKVVPDAAKTYKLNDKVLAAPANFPVDRRIRREVTTTINLRNRTP